MRRPRRNARPRPSSWRNGLLDELRYVGVLALELFEVGGRLLANEFAPRVHNTGHWTIDGAETSQFENHLRAILGLPLGATGALGSATMVNLIGEMPDAGPVARTPGRARPSVRQGAEAGPQARPCDPRELTRGDRRGGPGPGGLRHLVALADSTGDDMAARRAAAAAMAQVQGALPRAGEHHRPADQQGEEGTQRRIRVERHPR